MPPDNAATVAAGTPVEFPRNGPTDGATALRLTAATFSLPAIGVYEVSWQVSVTEPGQLVLTLNGNELDGAPLGELDTVAGRATGTSLITNTVLIETTVIDSVLEIRNPTGNTPALTITPSAGGTQAASAWLVIKRLL